MTSDPNDGTHEKLKKDLGLRKLYRRLVRLVETAVYGGRLREMVLVRLLGALHRSQFRREWRCFSDEPPHFFNQRWNGFEFTYGSSRTPYVFTRGFLACEILQDGDHLLDIGCGDGFFTNSFFSTRCHHIDAIDVDRSAIETAKRLNCSPKIDYYILDAVRQPFPSERYDVVVWDGAIGHFSKAELSVVLEKIARSLPTSGIFVGSESLGIEGSDHLQFFDDESALASVFKPYFKHVLIRKTEYRIGGGETRIEAYWRCSNDLSPRQMDTTWVDYAGRVASAEVDISRR